MSKGADDMEVTEIMDKIAECRKNDSEVIDEMVKLIRSNPYIQRYVDLQYLHSAYEQNLKVLRNKLARGGVDHED